MLEECSDASGQGYIKFQGFEMREAKTVDKRMRRRKLKYAIATRRLDRKEWICDM